MVKLKELFNKYKIWIFVILLILLGFKSCQSCQKDRQMRFYKNTSTLRLDSIYNEHQLLIKNIDSLMTEIKIRDQKISHMEKENNLLKETNNQYKQTNKELVKTLNKD